MPAMTPPTMAPTGAFDFDVALMRDEVFCESAELDVDDESDLRVVAFGIVGLIVCCGEEEPEIEAWEVFSGLLPEAEAVLFTDVPPVSDGELLVVTGDDDVVASFVL